MPSQRTFWPPAYRVIHFFFPLVTIAPTGFFQPRNGAVFLLAPMDNTHHLLFFGPYGLGRQRSQKELASVREDYEPDPRNFGALAGDRSNRWGQDRELMTAGHFTGFGRRLLEEDVAVQASMGPIVDRPKENLSSSDIAVAQARQLILHALAAAETGHLPSGERLESRDSSYPRSSRPDSGSRGGLAGGGAGWLSSIAIR